MNILQNIQTTTTSVQKPVETQKNVQQPKVEYKPDVLDILSEKVVNKNDLNDMVTTPRAIFKGYLCFTAGTTINAIAGMLKNNKITNGLRILGSLLSIYGTYNFVKPYLIRNDKLTNPKK